MVRLLPITACLLVALVGCTKPDEGSAPPPPTTANVKPETTPSTPATGTGTAGANSSIVEPPPKPAPNAPVEAMIVLDTYVHGQALTGRVIGYPANVRLGTLILALCSADEWRRAQSEGRPPVEVQTVTVDLDREEGNRFQFSASLDLTDAVMVYASDPNAIVRVRPVEARPRPGGPLDNAGPVDGVGTTGNGAPFDAHNPALRGPGG
ncbi:MAG: hypothetical protein ACO1SV_13760 [Fimbriimonas sp.]